MSGLLDSEGALEGVACESLGDCGDDSTGAMLAGGLSVEKGIRSGSDAGGGASRSIRLTHPLKLSVS